MREIKFKVWDIDNKLIIHTAIELKSDSILQRFNLQERTSSNVIWLQFTGLKDVKGVEIYEGDILEKQNGELFENGFFVPNIERRVVIWHVLGWALKNPDNGNIDIKYSGYYTDVQVIGNIHENPELLK